MAEDVTPKQKAKLGLALIKEAMLEHLATSADGLTNADLARDLGLQSDHDGNQRDYITYSVLGLLMKEGKVKKVKAGIRTLYTRA